MHVKGGVVPGGPEVPRFRGVVVSSTPIALAVAIADGGTPEVNLILNAPLERPVPPGTGIEFEGVATRFVADPFLLTVKALPGRPPLIADSARSQKDQFH
jgi:hypothetical protein